MPAGLRRARRSAAGARRRLAIAGAIFAVAARPRDRATTSPPVSWCSAASRSSSPRRSCSWSPRTDWLKLEESLAPLSAVLIIGLGPSGSTTSRCCGWPPWPAACSPAAGACSGSAGRCCWPRWRCRSCATDGHPPLRLVCLAAVALLLTCGRMTRELRAMLDRPATPPTTTASPGRCRGPPSAHRSTALPRPTARDGAVLLLDLDNFGAINKTSRSRRRRRGPGLGRRHAGPGSSVRTGFVGRLGGDEFAFDHRRSDPERVRPPDA